jgi:hypothetical protein
METTLWRVLMENFKAKLQTTLNWKLELPFIINFHKLRKLHVWPENLLALFSSVKLPSTLFSSLFPDPLRLNIHDNLLPRSINKCTQLRVINNFTDISRLCFMSRLEHSPR